MEGANIEMLTLPNQPRRRHLEGFPSFSHFIAGDRQEAIYRRFGSLSARNLLYQQSELHRLEHQLELYDAEDAQDLDDVAAQQRARQWESVATDDSDNARLRRELQLKIKSRVKEYRAYFSGFRGLIINEWVLLIKDERTR